MSGSDAVTYYFVRAWAAWLRGDLLYADLYIYQASGLAGHRWPPGYSLSKRVA